MKLPFGTVLNANDLAPGNEQYCYYNDADNRELCQYDYRHTNGDFFSCIKPNYKLCVKERNQWLKKYRYRIYK